MVNQTVTGESATQTRQYVLRSAQRTLALWETLELSTETTDFGAEANWVLCTGRERESARRRG